MTTYTGKSTFVVKSDIFLFWKESKKKKKRLICSFPKQPTTENVTFKVSWCPLHRAFFGILASDIFFRAFTSGIFISKRASGFLFFFFKIGHSGIGHFFSRAFFCKFVAVLQVVVYRASVFGHFFFRTSYIRHFFLRSGIGHIFSRSGIGRSSIFGGCGHSGIASMSDARDTLVKLHFHYVIQNLVIKSVRLHSPALFSIGKSWFYCIENAACLNSHVQFMKIQIVLQEEDKFEQKIFFAVKYIKTRRMWTSHLLQPSQVNEQMKIDRVIFKSSHQITLITRDVVYELSRKRSCEPARKTLNITSSGTWQKNWTSSVVKWRLCIRVVM